MSKAARIERLLDPGIIAIIRTESAAGLQPMAHALLAGGVTALEITMTTPGALGVIRDLATELGSRSLVGVGTVLDVETCRAAIDAGAEFVVTPVTRPEVIRLCNELECPVVSGAYSPTEALLGHESGADFTKIFPADHLGPAYMKSLLGPLPMLRIIPTGGVTPETLPAFVNAGCVAVGAGASLIDREAMDHQDWPRLTARAAAYVAAMHAARAR